MRRRRALFRATTSSFLRWRCGLFRETFAPKAGFVLHSSPHGSGVLERCFDSSGSLVAFFPASSFHRFLYWMLSRANKNQTGNVATAIFVYFQRQLMKISARTLRSTCSAFVKKTWTQVSKQRWLSNSKRCLIRIQQA